MAERGCGTMGAGSWEVTENGSKGSRHSSKSKCRNQNLLTGLKEQGSRHSSKSKCRNQDHCYAIDLTATMTPWTYKKAAFPVAFSGEFVNFFRLSGPDLPDRLALNA